MIDIKKLKPGMTVFDVKKNTGRDSYRSPWRTWQVVIKEVNIDKGEVLYYWNGNPMAFMMPAKNGKVPWRLTRPTSPTPSRQQGTEGQ